MVADFVWVTGGDQAKTFHLLPDDGGRRTMCGRFAGTRIMAGKPVQQGKMLPRADAVAAGLTDCRRCFGHSERRRAVVR